MDICYSAEIYAMVGEIYPGTWNQQAVQIIRALKIFMQYLMHIFR